MGSRIKKDDQVVVISGRDKGTRGRVLKVLRETNKVIIEGVGRVKKHQKPTQQNPQGGIIEKELPIHLSKVMLLDTKVDPAQDLGLSKPLRHPRDGDRHKGLALWPPELRAILRPGKIKG